jgi:hypothetical protein
MVDTDTVTDTQIQTHKYRYTDTDTGYKNILHQAKHCLYRLKGAADSREYVRSD